MGSAYPVGKHYSGPWTFSLPEVIEARAVDVETDVDIGTDPQLGDVMELNRTIDVAGQQVILTTVKLDTGRDGATWLDLHFETEPDFVTGISAWDMNNRSKGRISGHEAGSKGSFDTGWSYDYLPAGVVTVTINQISLRHPETLAVYLDTPSELR